MEVQVAGLTVNVGKNKLFTKTKPAVKAKKVRTAAKGSPATKTAKAPATKTAKAPATKTAKAPATKTAKAPTENKVPDKAEFLAERHAATMQLPAPKAEALSVKSDKRLSPLRTKHIRVLVEGNPRRAGFRGAKIFALYVTGMAVEEFFKLGGHLGDINWDVERKHIELY